jgi:hypothetical protein
MAFKTTVIPGHVAPISPIQGQLVRRGVFSNLRRRIGGIGVKFSGGLFGVSPIRQPHGTAIQPPQGFQGAFSSQQPKGRPQPAILLSSRY